VDADSAVRRAYALATNPKLANLDGFGNNEFPSKPGPTGNNAPRVSVITDKTVPEGSTLSVPMSFTENTNNRSESWTYSVDWGDGSYPDKGSPIIDVPVGAIDNRPGRAKLRGPFGHIDGSHTYAKDGTYTVTVMVTDSEGAPGVQSFQVTVT